MMQTSVLFDKQKSLNAQFETVNVYPFVRVYSNKEEEYHAARERVAVMDRSYLGQLRLTGQDHTDLLHRITTNELRHLKPGEGQINIFTNEKGRIIDRVFLYRSPDAIRLITSALNEKSVSEWIDKYIFIEDVTIESLDTIGLLSLFGPQAEALLQKAFGEDFGALAVNHFRDIDWQGNPVMVTRTPELSLSGFNVMADSESLPALWDHLMQVGTKFELVPMGEEAYETLRIESGWPRFQQDFDDSVNPHEAGMFPYINFDKGCYIGQEVIARLDTYDKVQKHLKGIFLEGDVLPAKDDTILAEEKKVGRITSATYSPQLKKNIALGYVRTKSSQPGTAVTIEANGDSISGELCELPFKADKDITA